MLVMMRKNDETLGGFQGRTEGLERLINGYLLSGDVIDLVEWGQVDYPAVLLCTLHRYENAVRLVEKGYRLLHEECLEEDFMKLLPHLYGDLTGDSFGKMPSMAQIRLKNYLISEVEDLAEDAFEELAEVIADGVDVHTTQFVKYLVPISKDFPDLFDLIVGAVNPDDFLTLLAHLGYLAYYAEHGTVRIPNEEIRMEFSSTVREVKHSATLERLKESDRLFYDTIHGNGEAVAAQIEKIHAEETVPLHYNREDSLRSVIKLAYFTYRDNYLMWEELPSGDGYADIVYLPKRASDYPALVIELKWNHTAEGAIRQILDRRYPDALKSFGGEIILVGISYNRDEKGTERHHTCKIQRL